MANHVQLLDFDAAPKESHDMRGNMDRVNVAIVGGGAAGISAARKLIECGRSVLLLEALPRLGGRARTETIHGLPLDLGCEWLHSADRNPLRSLAEENGFAVDRREHVWERSLPNRMYRPEERQQASAAYERFIAELRARRAESDRASHVFATDDPWRPFVDALSTFINGTEIDSLSVADFLTYEDASTDTNWRLSGGYGAFISAMSAGVPHASSTRVTKIAHDKSVVLETDRGLIEADAAIVTVSTTVLAGGAIDFAPAVTDHLHAASRLPLGIADKVFLSLADPDAIPPDTHLVGRLDRAETASHLFRPHGRPVIECYVGGKFALGLECSGEAEAAAFAIGELRDLLGSEFARGLSPIAFTRWAHEPTILGSYSHALPGHAGARAILARPVSERLCFAGEACSPEDFSTAHGAWQSGITAAHWIDRHLEKKAVGSPVF